MDTCEYCGEESETTVCDECARDVWIDNQLHCVLDDPDA